MKSMTLRQRSSVAAALTLWRRMLKAGNLPVAAREEMRIAHTHGPALTPRELDELLAHISVGGADIVALGADRVGALREASILAEDMSRGFKAAGQSAEAEGAWKVHVILESRISEALQGIKQAASKI